MADTVLSNTISFREDAHDHLEWDAEKLMEQEGEEVIAEARPAHSGRAVTLKPERHHQLEHGVGLYLCDAFD
ncbi:hypothetical protein SUDANB121_01085 [Nocardiopsis dassonvillei]|uniref:hypothetical protein n=1 Tax=Nocardiopsis dassonvillei TaxID=2014 RepID=UPI003F577779